MEISGRLKQKIKVEPINFAFRINFLEIPNKNCIKFFSQH